MFFLSFLVDGLIKKSAKKTANLFDEFVGEKERVLDIGAGFGWIAKELQKKKGADITILDVVNLNQTDLPHFLYNGEEMPFLENNFNTALLVDVLHHCSDPLQVLREAKRVAKEKIIILEEDLPTFWLSRLSLYFVDFISNLAFCFLTNRLTKMVNLPFHFKKISEWEQILGDLNLQIVQKKKVSFFNMRGAIFVVHKTI